MTPLARYAFASGAGWAATALDRAAVLVNDRFCCFLPWRALPEALKRGLEAPRLKGLLDSAGDSGIRRPCRRRAGARLDSDMVDYKRPKPSCMGRLEVEVVVSKVEK